jgi:hypothetical protein
VTSAAICLALSASGRPLAVIFNTPRLTVAIFTGEGPPGAEAFLYLKTVEDPFVLQRVAGKLNVTAPLPSLKLMEESPPNGSEPIVVIAKSLDSRTILDGLVNRSLFPAIAVSGSIRLRAQLPQE